jgi:DNA repair exonuclease SbcCD ATPase subunit
MIKILHIADIHIRNTERHEEYQRQFEKLYKVVQDNNIDIVAIVGDLVDNFIEISNEAKIIAGGFLNNLSKLCSEVILVPGNHDLRKKNLNRINSVETIVKLIDNPKIVYFNKSGFFDDKLTNIVWVNHSHLEKKINPWINITHVIDKSKIYIDLFHDPINGCSTDTGIVFNDPKIRNISDFKGQISLLGDIHLHQALGKNKNIVYPSSLVQQNFGENVDLHGCVIWNINSKDDISWKFINIENDHTYINLYINEMSDYDNLSLDANNIGTDTEIKVHWKEYSSNINTINEKKIRDYIKNKFNTNKVKFDKTFIYNDIISSKMLSESLDLTDLQVQLNIFKEYLEEQKYDKNDISEILKIDDIINSRLNLSKDKLNIQWNIDKFWFSNFKSYGDDNEVDWKDINGILQINGLNQEGKTTILDAITYILYGKTTTTLSVEKFGDNRYINNKRNLDYCLGGAVIDVDGEKFTIERKTDRKWNKTNTGIVSCSTVLEFYNGEIVEEQYKLTGEIKNKTQKKLDSILGDLSDFIRLSFTNANNLEDMLSQTRSVFIDNIIRDAGYDVFETKLEEFKEYKKELSEEKIIIDVQESETNIVNLNSEIEEEKNKIIEKNEQLKNIDLELSELNKKRDNLNKKLNKIDESMLSFNEDINLNSIENFKNKINDANIQLVILDKEINELPDKFDANNLEKLKLKLKEINNKISERKDEISNIRNSILDIDNKKDKILSKIEDLRENEIKRLTLKISDNQLKIEIIKNKKENVINTELKTLTSNIQSNELKISEITNEMKLLQKDGSNIKNTNDELDKEIEELKNSSKCSACGRDFDKNDPNYSDHLAHLEEKINQLLFKKEDNETKIQKLLVEYKKLKNTLPELEEKKSALIKEKENIKNGIYSEELKNNITQQGSSKDIKNENEELKRTIEELNNKIYDNSLELKDRIDKGLLLLKSNEKERENSLLVISNIEAEIKGLNIEGIENDVEIEEKNKYKFENRKQKISQKENIKLSIENFNLKINELKSEIVKYQDVKLKIEENKIIQSEIKVFEEEINKLKVNIKRLSDENVELEKIILLKNTEITNISNKIKQYIKQKKREELLKEYQKCISRDGIPTFLLKKSIHIINKELNDLLSNVNFILFFDENLILRLSANDRLDVSQNAIESSGKEKTFCALALKVALRQINIKSKPNFMVMDEIMGKLLANSVQEFIEFLDELKKKINKIIIIEHTHNINYDALISVKKDENLISSLEIDY